MNYVHPPAQSVKSMSNGPKIAQVFAPTMGWLVPVAVAGVALVAVISYVRSEETPVAGGSPLYGQAVHEALDGLKNPAAKTAAAPRPALPAGLAPEDYYWCPTCKAYHQRQPAQGQPADAVHSPLAGTPAGTLAAQPDAAIPPLPAGLSPNDYYWCTHCKAYHPRQQAAGVSADGVPYRLEPPPTGTEAAPGSPVAPASVAPATPEGTSTNPVAPAIPVAPAPPPPPPNSEP